MCHTEEGFCCPLRLQEERPRISMYQVLTVRDEVTKDIPPGLVKATPSILRHWQCPNKGGYHCQELWRRLWNSSRG